MSKYHISPKTGKPAPCRASARACPIGGDHYPTKVDAESALASNASKEQSIVPPSLQKAARSAPTVLFRKFFGKQNPAEVLSYFLTQRPLAEGIETSVIYTHSCDICGIGHCNCGYFTVQPDCISVNALINDFYQEVKRVERYNYPSDEKTDNFPPKIPHTDEGNALKEVLYNVLDEAGLLDPTVYEIQVLRELYGDTVFVDEVIVQRGLPEATEKLNKIFNGDN
jgi:hypothetical protein